MSDFSLPNTLIGEQYNSLVIQSGYPNASRDGAEWTLSVQWLIKSSLAKVNAPAHLAAVSTINAIPEPYKTDYAELICSSAGITPYSMPGLSLVEAVFKPEEAPEFNNTDEDSWETNTVYKEICLSLDDIKESDLTSSPSEGTLEERKQAHLKALKEAGRGTKATAEVQLVYSTKFNGSLTESNIIGSVGQNESPPGVPGASDDNWIHTAKSIRKSKSEKVETNTFQFFNRSGT